jgi:hypothetical protein
MASEIIHKAVSFGDFAVTVSALRLTCEFCGHSENFPDDPMPEGRSLSDASNKGWRGLWDEESTACPSCAARAALAKGGEP